MKKDFMLRCEVRAHPMTHQHVERHYCDRLVDKWSYKEVDHIVIVEEQEPGEDRIDRYHR